MLFPPNGRHTLLHPNTESCKKLASTEPSSHQPFPLHGTQFLSIFPTHSHTSSLIEHGKPVMRHKPVAAAIRSQVWGRIMHETVVEVATQEQHEAHVQGCCCSSFTRFTTPFVHRRTEGMHGLQWSHQPIKHANF